LKIYTYLLFRQILNQTSSKTELISRWVFLGTDGWGKKGYPVAGFANGAVNSITIAPKLYPIAGLNSFYQIK